MLSCPRCAEILDDLQGGVFLCVRCEGLWIQRPALAKLVDLKWPVGRLAWWRNELACPECSAEAVTTLMRARSAEGIFVDDCAQHGAWFDRGELTRIIDGEDDDLAAVRSRIQVAAPTPSEIEERRAKYRGELELRRKALATYRKAVEDERAANEERLQRAAAEAAAVLAAEQRRHRDALLTARDAALAKLNGLEREHAADYALLQDVERRMEKRRREIDAARDELAVRTRALKG